MNSAISRLEQLTIEDKYSRSNIRANVSKDILSSRGIATKIAQATRLLDDYFDKYETYYEAKQRRIDAYRECCELSNDELVIEMMILIFPHQEAQSIQAVAGRLADHFNMPDVFVAVKVAAELLAVVCQSDLYDIIAAKNSDTGGLMVKSNYSLEDETKQFIANTCYLPPIITKPNEIKHNLSSGYLNKTQSVILGDKVNHHDYPVALDVLNIANSIELELDRFMLQFEEKPSKPLDTQEKIDNFRLMANSSKVIYKEIIETGNTFHFNNRFDSRGRLYTEGYHINIQSTDYKKSLINLKKQEVISLT